MTIFVYMILFFIYAVLGWIMEVTVGIVERKKFVNRGFLIGPYCPIYGAGGAAITFFLQKYVNDPIVLFCVAIVICGVLEYLTSYVMEKIFKARWWDYSKKKFNINGRVCLETIIPFGLLGCLIIYVINPFVLSLLDKVPTDILNLIAEIIAGVFIVDFVISYFIIARLRKTAKQVKKSETCDNTEEITKKVREILINRSVLDRRLINAFPKFSIDMVKQRIKETTEQVKENVSKVKEGATEKIKESAEKVKETTIKVKEGATEIIKEGAEKVKDTTVKAKEGATELIKGGTSKIKDITAGKQKKDEDTTDD